MDFNILISELRSSSEHLSSDSGDKSLLSSGYCNNACKALQRVTETDSDYDSIITGLWLIVAHFAEQSGYLRPVPALSELCFKLFRQCAKAILNIQWQNLDEDSSVRQNFLVSIANLHAKLVPFDFPRFRLLETLTENPWTNPTLAKIMGGEVEPSDKEEVGDYIQQEDPIILQLRVDMMLKENCEEYALNLCTSCLMHPELATDLSLRITQLSLLYKMGHEDKLQEECQRLSIQEALRVIKELNNSGKQKELYTVLAQTFMVQNWIRPCDTDNSKELLRMWIRHQLLVDREHDQFKDSIWAMAKLSHSTEQIVIIIDVLREECGDTFLQLYVDMSIFALKVDKGQMETSIKENNLEAAAARRADMASVCTKLSCLCHHTSNKVGKICALTSFALRPTQESFNKIGAFYGQGGNCCDKCGQDKLEANAINPATLYEVERLLNMLRPDYLNPENTYPHIHVMCRRFLLESLRNAQAPQKKLGSTPNGDSTVVTQVEGPGRKKPSTNKATMVFEALSPKDVQDRQSLLAMLRMQNVTNLQPNSPYTNRASAHTKTSPASSKSKDSLVSSAPNIINPQQKQQRLQNQQEQYLSRLQQQLEKQSNSAQAKHTFKQQTPASMHTQQVSQIIQLALKKDPMALEQISKTAPAAVVQAIASIIKNSNVKQVSQQPNETHSSLPEGGQSLPTVSTLLRPPTASSSQQQLRQQPPPRKYPRPQLYAQPIIVSSGTSSTMTQGSFHSQPASLQPTQLNSPTPQAMASQRELPALSQTQQQRAESLSISKAHVQGVRQFMQSQLSALQAGQKNLTSRGGNTYGTPSGRVKTTEELAQQAAMVREAKKQQQQQKQARLSQDSAAFPGVRSSISSGMLPVISTINRQPNQEVQLIQHNVRQQPVPRQTGANLFSSVESSFQSPLTSSGMSQGSLLPSSDELLGSITGIDDTIINDLLQDSGLLSNTFPDIEVDVLGEDRGRGSSTFGQLMAGQANSRIGPSVQNTQSLSRSMLATLSRVSTSGQTRQSKAEATSVLPQNLRLQQSQVPSSSSLSINQQPSGFEQQPLAQPRTAEQARMDQINQQMKQEDIPGEMCVDAANNATYRCIICSLAFETLDLLREHVRNICKPGLQSSSVYTSKIEQDKANSAKAGLETTTVFQCLRCFELCISEAGIKEHRLTCKRVPTIPSDIKKEAAAAASKSKSRSGSSHKHSSVKSDSGSSSRPQSRNNTSVLSSHSSQKASSAALQSVSTGSGVAVKLGVYQPQSIKNEPHAHNVASYPNHGTPTPSVSPAAFSPSSSNSPQAEPTASLPSQLPQKAPSNISTLATSLPMSFGSSRKSLSLTSLKYSEMSSPPAPFPQPPFPAAKHSASTASIQFALDQNVKTEFSVSSSNPNGLNWPNPQTQPKNESRQDSKNELDISSPKYSEISGSGGSKFFKCELCSQVLCSFSSFKAHWKDCVLKYNSAAKKKVRKEKTPAEPLQGKLLENVISVIESVASGQFDKSGQLAEGDHKVMMNLRDPCVDQTHDTVSSVEGDGADSEVSWDSRATFEAATDSEQDRGKHGSESKKLKSQRSQLAMISEGEQCIESSLTGSEKNDCRTRKKCRKTGTGSEEEEEEDDASLSGSESGSSALNSTREAPPKLRDRKLLKPIQSFINETFISPFHMGKRLTRVMEENAVSESTTSGAESDEDHLFCRVCKKPLQSQRLQLEHYVSKHLKPYTVKVVSDSSSYFCHLCQKTYPTFPLYMKHIPNHSTLITEKMKLFNKSPRVSLHRDRLANKKGMKKTKKKSLSPKLAKALKSKKAATKSAANRIKRQMLMLKGQVPPERLKFMNRQRNSFRTSSEDDYSSDASNLMFKPKKPILMIRQPDGKFVRRKRGRPRKDLLPEDIVPADQVDAEESQHTTASNTADEDGNSDTTGSASPLSTRSCKRCGNMEGSPEQNGVKRRRHFSYSEGLPLDRKDALLSEYDTDSNSTTLSISVRENGCVIPASENKRKPETKEGADVNHLSEQSFCEKLSDLSKLKVMSLSKRQKERLLVSDLNPSVILDALDLDSLGRSSANAEKSLLHSSTESKELTESKTTKQPTFLDSYLSYIDNYKKFSSKKPSSNKSQSLKQNKAVSLPDMKKAQGIPKSLKQTSSASLTEGTGSQDKDKVPSETEDRPSSSQSDKTWTYSMRRCSVNLGQKISLSDIQFDVNDEVEGEDQELPSEISHKPIVCLERRAEVENCVVSSVSTAVVDSNSGNIAKSDLSEGQVLTYSGPEANGLQPLDKKLVLGSSSAVPSDVQASGLNDSNSPIRCDSPASDDNSSTDIENPNDTRVVQRLNSTESSPSSCGDLKNKGGEEEDVVILEASDEEEEEAEQDTLEDMVIVVNNEVEDDENDEEDVIVINEESSHKSKKAESKEESVTDTGIKNLPASKQELSESNGPKNDQTSIIYSVDDDEDSKNGCEQEKTSVEESSDLKPREQSNDVEEVSRLFDVQDSSTLCLEQETMSKRILEPEGNTLVEDGVNIVNLSKETIGDAFTSTITTKSAEDEHKAKACEGPIKSEKKAEKKDCGDEKDARKDIPIEIPADIDTGCQVRVDDAGFNEKKASVCPPNQVQEDSDILISPVGRAERNKNTDESQPMAVEDQSEIKISSHEQTCKIGKSASEFSSLSDRPTEHSILDRKTAGNKVIEIGENQQVNFDQLKRTADESSKTKSEWGETETEVTQLDTGNLSKPHHCSEEAAEQKLEMQVKGHIGSVCEVADLEGNKTSDDSKSEPSSCELNSNSIENKGGINDDLETSSSLNDLHQTDKTSFADRKNSSEDHSETSVVIMSKDAFENQLKDESPFKESPVDSSMTNTEISLPPFNDPQNHLDSTDLQSQSIVGPDAALLSNEGTIANPQELFNIDSLQNDDNVLTKETLQDGSQKKANSESAVSKDANDKPDSDLNLVDKQIKPTSPIILKEVNLCTSKEKDHKFEESETEVPLRDVPQQNTISEIEEKEEQFQPENLSETIDLNGGLTQDCPTDDDVNSGTVGDKTITKSPSKPEATVLRNSHLSLAAFIAERLLTKEPSQETDSQNVSPPDDHPQNFSVMEPISGLQNEDLKVPKEILQNDISTCELRPQKDLDRSEEIHQINISTYETRADNDPNKFEKIFQGDDLRKPEKHLQDPNGEMEGVEDLQDDTVAVGTGLVDYSCSSEENSRDGNPALSEPGDTENSNQVSIIEATDIINPQRSPRSIDNLELTNEIIQTEESSSANIPAGSNTAKSEEASTNNPQESIPSKEDLELSKEIIQTEESGSANIPTGSNNATEEIQHCSDLTDDKTHKHVVKESMPLSVKPDVVETKTHNVVDLISFDRKKLGQNEFEPENIENISSNSSASAEGKELCEGSRYCQPQPVDACEKGGDKDKTYDENNSQILEKQSQALNLKFDDLDEISKKESQPHEISNQGYGLDKPSVTSWVSTSENDAKIPLQDKEEIEIEDSKSKIEHPAFPGQDKGKNIDKMNSSLFQIPSNEKVDITETLDSQWAIDNEKYDEKHEVPDGNKMCPSLPQPSSSCHPSQEKVIANSPSPKKRVTVESSNDDTDDGDDLSSFELVIEEDTSSRSIVTFPDKHKEPVTPHPKKTEKADFKVSFIEDAPEAKIVATSLMGTAQKHVYNPSPKKVLAGAKSLGKGVLNQFVWGDDSDEDNCSASGYSLAAKSSEIESQQPAIKAPQVVQPKQPVFSEMPVKRKALEDSTLDPVNRKRKALREKTETAPFTWDLEDNVEKAKGTMKVLSVKDSSLLIEAQLANRKSSKAKTKQVSDVKRPNNLKVKIPSGKEGKTGQTGAGTLPSLNEALSGSAAAIERVINVETTGKDIQVDEEIFFKRGSVPSTPTDSPVSQSLEIHKESVLNSKNSKQRKSGVGNVNSHSDSRCSPPSERKNGELSPKSQASLRSRHSSVESNGSDTSTAGATPALKQRRRNGEETHHSKAGLIKVGNSSNISPVILAHNGPTAAAKDASVHNTRSSGAAVKALNEKSLRNRGVNPLSSKKHSREGAPPRHKAATAKASTPGNHVQIKTPPLNKTSLTPQTKLIKGKSGSMPISQENTKKLIEVITPKAKIRSLLEPKSDGLKKAKSQSSLAKPKVSSAKQTVGKANSVVRKVKSVVVNKAKSVSSVVSKGKTQVSAVRKTKNGPTSSGKAKAVPTAAGKTKPASPSKKTGASLAKKSSKSNNKARTPSSTKMSTKKSYVKVKSQSTTKSTASKSREKKAGPKK